MLMDNSYRLQICILRLIIDLLHGLFHYYFNYKLNDEMEGGNLNCYISLEVNTFVQISHSTVHYLQL